MAENENTDLGGDEVKRLEHVLDEIAVRESHEQGRQSSADSKLTGSLAILPIIVGLSTTSFFQMLPYAARSGTFGITAALVFLCAIVCFLVAAWLAIDGLWPRKNQYSVVARQDILKYLDTGTYTQQLRHMIAERSTAVGADGAVNARKLGRYMDAQKWVAAGLAVLALTAFSWLGALMVSPTILYERQATASAVRVTRLLPHRRTISGSENCKVHHLPARH